MITHKVSQTSQPKLVGKDNSMYLKVLDDNAYPLKEQRDKFSQSGLRCRAGICSALAIFPVCRI